jgi:hypothetical protein
MAEGLDAFGSKTVVLDACMHITTYSISSGTSIHFIQEYVSNTLFIASTFLYL